MNIGLSFEKRIEKLYTQLGKKGVEHNILLRYKGSLSQFDLSYGLSSRYFIECKYRSLGPVPFSDVATFSAKLQLHGIKYKRGIMVTNVHYDKRSQVYARKVGLKLVDGEKLKRLENSPFSLWNKLSSLQNYF